MNEITQKPVVVCLAGNPNSGKTTLFNRMTGLHQHVGNFPGVTVDVKMGKMVTDKSAYSIIDLPGAYDLYGSREDEKVAAQVLSDVSHKAHPDKIIYVADATNLKRHLYYFSQICELGIPAILVLNMSDLAEKEGLLFDTEKLSVSLGVPVLLMNARSEENTASLLELVDHHDTPPPSFISHNMSNGHDDIMARYQKIATLIKSCTGHSGNGRHGWTDRIDHYVTHPFWGFIIFSAILLLVFQAVFSWAAYPTGWIESGFNALSRWLGTSLPDSVLKDLTVNGILAGISGVMVFVPQIALLFMCIAILEDSGYMARVSFLMDRTMRRFGLSGRSVIPLISGAACAVPAIMGSRTIENRTERLITILVTPLITCSARLPVYTLIIALIIPDKDIFGFISLKALTMLALYLLGALSALVVALILSKTVRHRIPNYLMLEMPVYRPPQVSNVLMVMWQKVRQFSWNAGKIIFLVSVVLWFLASYGPPGEMDRLKDKYSIKEGLTQQSPEGDSLRRMYAKERIEVSYAGIVGHAMEPVIRPMGFNWKMGIAIITTFAAREVFVGTMSTIYAVSDAGEENTLKEKMLADKDSINGTTLFSFATGISLLIFFAFAMQCFSTLAVSYRETKSIRWPLIQFAYMSILAYCLSTLSYWLLS